MTHEIVSSLNISIKFMTVREFCGAHRISAATFYNLRAKGLGPQIAKIGARTFISPEAAEAWRLRMQETG